MSRSRRVWAAGLGLCLVMLWCAFPVLAGAGKQVVVPVVPSPVPAAAGVPAALTPAAASPASAIENEPLDGPATSEHAYHPLSKLLPLLLSLGLVCIVCLVLLPVFLSKTSLGSRRGGAPGAMMRILDRQVLAPQKTICLVEVAGRYLLIGISDKQISTLAELESEAVTSRLAQGAQVAPQAFPGPLGVWLGRYWQPGKK